MEGDKSYTGHVMVLPFHGQGHINPMLQFSKRLASKGLKITFTTTLSNTATIHTGPGNPISLEPIYDDVSQGGLAGEGGFKGYIERFESICSDALAQLISKFDKSDQPVNCLVYDANLPWALDIAKRFSLPCAAFFTQSCAAIAGYYPMYKEMCGEPLTVPALSLPGLCLPQLGLPNLHSFGSYEGRERFPPIVKHILNQFHNIDKADWILFNSFDKLEEEVVKWMKTLWPVQTIGPTIPSIYLDKKVKGDIDYGFNLYKPNNKTCIDWLNTKESKSVVYVSFGSAASLNATQMSEMAMALKQNNHNFLWVVKESEENKLPTIFTSEIRESRGMIVSWCSQLEVLAHEAVGCFVTHCGWNSTMEAISNGVAMVGMPQFLDQMTNAYFVENVWGVGVKAVGLEDDDEKGGGAVILRDEIERCIDIAMNNGEKREGIEKNCMKWKDLAKKAVDENGSSDRYIDDIIARLLVASS